MLLFYQDIIIVAFPDAPHAKSIILLSNLKSIEYASIFSYLDKSSNDSSVVTLSR